MKSIPFLCIAQVLLISSAGLSSADIMVEHLPPGAKPAAFVTVPRPSKTDAAQGAVLRLLDGKFSGYGGSEQVLTDGLIPPNGNEIRDNVVLEGTTKGRWLMDLGKITAVAAVCSYSYHEFDGDGGARAPQVYRLYGSAAAKPDGGDPSKNEDWIELAVVDTRPASDGGDWGGQYGVAIRGTNGKDLGSFRWLQWVVEPTLSPKQSAHPEYTQTFYNEFDVHTRETLAKAGDATISIDAQIEEIIVVFKSHFDIGFTHLASEVIHNYRTKMIDDALKVVDQNRDLPADQQFVWTVPGWPMKTILEDWPEQTAERQKQVRAAFKEGRFVAHALPFTMQTEMMEPEGMVRGLGFASQLARTVGKPLSTGAKMTDVPSHSWILPTLLTHAGVKFLHLGCNPASATPRVPLLFWWEGPDGSRVLTMYTPSYGGNVLPPKNWPYKTWLAMLMKNDNEGPPKPAEVKAVIESIHKSLPGVKVRIGTLDDFGDRILAENPQVPVIRSDMPDTWIHGLMTDPECVRLARQTMPTIAGAEALHTLLGGWKVKTSDISSAVADVYEKCLLFYEHTWGGAFANMGLGDYLPPKNDMGQVANWKYGEAWKAELAAGRYNDLLKSFDEHSEYARHAEKVTTMLMQTQMRGLAAAVAVNGPRTVVFNPLPWVRDGVPALGYKTQGKTPPPELPSAEPAANALSNKYFKVTLDPARGSIVSLVDKRTNRELVDADATHGFGQVLYERFSANEVLQYNRAYLRGAHWWGPAAHGKPNMPPASEVPYLAVASTNSTIDWKREGAVASVELRSKSVGFPATTRVILNGDAPYVDLEVTIEKPADIWPEAVWVCLPFKMDAPQFRIGRNGSIINPATDIISGANRYMCAVGTGVALFDSAGRGAGICGLDTPLVSLGEPGCWKFDHFYVPTKPAVYFNLFNNHWSCNYRLWNEGKWTFRFRIWSFDKYDAESTLITPALEARYPLQTATYDGPAGTLPQEQSGVSLSRAGILVTAFGNNPDGDGTVLRFWEQAGTSGELTCTLPAGATYKTATPVNLRGEKTGEPKTIKQGRITFDLHAYAPASFILQ
jgi:hypothetical protein